MGFKAKLLIGNMQFDILEFEYQLQRDTDINGMPSSPLRGGKISILLESMGDTFFFEWMCNGFEKKAGTINLLKTDEDASFKVINFRNAYLVSYKEKLDCVNYGPAIETVTLSAMEISIGKSNVHNEWP